MKRKIINAIKKNEFLYAIAKKIYRFLNINNINVKDKFLINDAYYISYFMREEEDFEKIKNHYNNINLSNKKLLIILIGTKFDLSIHNLFEENTNISFVSVEYMLKYNRRFFPSNLILLDFNKENDNYNKLFQVIKRRS